MNCIECGLFCRTRGTKYACKCLTGKPIHACCVEKRGGDDYTRCAVCNHALYRAGEWRDCVVLWEESLLLHLRAALVDFAWMAFMYVGYNVRWAIPGWGVYYLAQFSALRAMRGPLPQATSRSAPPVSWWKLALSAWILMYPVLNGLVVAGAAPRWTLYPYMEGRDILADLLPLFFYTLCIERGKNALIWMALPRRLTDEKRKRRAFLGVAMGWYDEPARIALLFAVGWVLYALHVMIVRGAAYNVLLLPFYCGFVFLLASIVKPRRMPHVAY